MRKVVDGFSFDSRSMAVTFLEERKKQTNLKGTSIDIYNTEYADVKE